MSIPGYGDPATWPKCLIGKKFGRLTVTSIAPIQRNASGKTRSAVEVVCDCGKTKVIATTQIQSGTSSCGCLSKELLSNRATTHGMSKTRAYKIWKAMRERCLNPTSSGYKKYGARGITVCDRWSSFELFLLDMGEAPEGTSIDRINTYGNYEPENCRWATLAQQAVNTRRNYLITINGITKCSTEWARDYGVNPRTVKKRITGLGWSPLQALTEPVTKTGLKKRRDSHV